jgi:hypothetical protein
MFGKPEIIGFGGDGFEVKVISKTVSNDMILKNHYSKKVAGFATTYIYLGVFIENNLIGTLQYGFLMNPASCTSIHKDSTVNTSVELNRAWYADGLDKNIKSKALSYSIKYLRGIKPNLIFIQSFADERCGKLGITYQAANFIYYGLHNSIFWEYDGKFHHNIAMTIKDKNNSLFKNSSFEPKFNGEYCKKIIELVGEPMLQSSLIELYAEAYPSEKKSYIENQIERLKKLI